MGRFWTDRNWRINRIMWRFKRSGGFSREIWPCDSVPTELMKIIRGKILSMTMKWARRLFPRCRHLDATDTGPAHRRDQRRRIHADLRTISEIRPDLCKGTTDADGNIRNRTMNVYDQSGLQELHCEYRRVVQVRASPRYLEHRFDGDEYGLNTHPSCLSTAPDAVASSAS
jgi:hypothetical protein